MGSEMCIRDSRWSVWSNNDTKVLTKAGLDCSCKGSSVPSPGCSASRPQNLLSVCSQYLLCSPEATSFVRQLTRLLESIAALTAKIRFLWSIAALITNTRFVWTIAALTANTGSYGALLH